MEQIALLVAQENGCTYCVSAHTLRGSRMGLTAEELLRTRAAQDDDVHVGAVLALTQAIVRTAGRVDSAALATARAAGVTDEEVAEIVAHIALNTLSNYFSHVAEPDLDFPEVSA
ncbi:carboxymuconolactone decarboxylase family protein [Nonomuraea africana]|uniref:carboxymuconolactone decarboxylase family protein n=1 Tax=Nonomuraea africana TaxID=46171 RepID=UPI0033E387FA